MFVLRAVVRSPGSITISVGASLHYRQCLRLIRTIQSYIAMIYSNKISRIVDFFTRPFDGVRIMDISNLTYAIVDVFIRL